MSQSESTVELEKQEKAPSLRHSAQDEEINTNIDEEHSQKPAEKSPLTFPDGGLQAWLVVFGAAVAVGCSLGYVNSFGVFEAYYLENQLKHKTPSQVAWIGSLQTFFQFFVSLIAGALFDKIGPRMLIIPASIGLPFSIFMTSLCKEYYQFILSQGVLSGICIGFLFTPSVSVVSHWFLKKRGMANGIVVAGSSVGGVLYPILLKNLLESKSIGFGWSIRIVGFIVLGLLVIPCVLVRSRLPPQPKEMKAVLPFKQASYSFLVLGLFLSIWGTFVPLFYVSSYAVNKVHMSTGMAFYILSILNGASCFGRILTGLIADKTGPMNTTVGVAVIVSILLFCWPQAKTEGGLIIWTVFFGYWSGAVISLMAPCFAQIANNPQLVGMYIGQAIGVLSISCLVIGPMAGAIITSSGYSGVSYFAGATMLGGAGFMMVGRLFQERKLIAKV